MDRERKRELVEAWKNRRPEMGVFSLRCQAVEESFLTAAADIPAKWNRIRFQLSAGRAPNQRLQAIWNQYGADGFVFQVIKRLEYKEPQEDYTEELEALLEQCLSEDPTARRIWK